MLSYKESLKILKETNALLEGHFILSSGLHSDKYVQCAKLLSKPGRAKEVCSSLAEKIREKYKDIDLVVNIGDELDQHALSFHDTDPDLPSAGDELQISRNYIKQLEKMYPEMVLLHSNHSSSVSYTHLTLPTKRIV